MVINSNFDVEIYDPFGGGRLDRYSVTPFHLEGLQLLTIPPKQPPASSLSPSPVPSSSSSSAAPSPSSTSSASKKGVGLSSLSSHVSVCRGQVLLLAPTALFALRLLTWQERVEILEVCVPLRFPLSCLVTQTHIHSRSFFFLFHFLHFLRDRSLWCLCVV
jgi:hypothetical protein